MATVSAPKGSLKETFAKVAAMTNRQLSQPEVSESSISSLETADQSSTTNTSLSSVPQDGQFAMQIKPADANSTAEDQLQVAKIEVISSTVDALHIGDDSSDVAAKKSDLDRDMPSTEKREGEFAMDRLPTSVSELSTKLSSLDGKSTTSGMTFALDEKESLRPDDSASAKATEEEDYYTGPGGANSRLSSEQGARAFRAQFNEISERIGYTSQPQASSSHYISSTQQELGLSRTAPSHAVNNNISPLHGADISEPPLAFGFNKLGPDEKLLEALENPKDRLFVLRLEQDVIEFVKDSKEPTLELPPCNSFCRLLIHKLADYYFLTHFVDTNFNAVRLFRTPFCRLPPPLTGISNPPTSGSTPPPNGPTMKIMRRDNMEKNNIEPAFQSNSGGNSVKASRAASIVDGEVEAENGKDNAESFAKEKGNMTREQREAKYKEARERIFKGFEETDGDERKAAADMSKQTSRSSSRSGKNKSGGKRGRSTVDDGFEARSQVAAFYPPSQPPFQMFSGPIPYNPYPMQPVNLNGQFTTTSYAGDFQPYNRGFVQPMPSQSVGPYTAPTNQFYFDATIDDVNQPFPSTAPNFAAPAQMPHHVYASPDNDNMSFTPVIPGNYPPNFRQPPYPQPQQPNGHWSQYPPQSLPQPHTPRSTFSSHVVENHTEPNFPNGMSSPYPYGQLPHQVYHQNSQQVSYQHPVPGSFNRHAFNPRTQPFIPGGKVPGGQPNHYVPSFPHAAGFQTAFSHPSNMPSHPGASNHGLNQARSPQLRPAQFAPMNHSRMPPATQGFPGSSMPNHESKMSQPPQQTTLPRWGQQHNLPPKPPVVTPSSRIPPRHLVATNQGQLGAGNIPTVGKGPQRSPNVGPVPSQAS